MADAVDGGAAYWLRWQVPVCALIFAVPTVAAVFVVCRTKTPFLSNVDLWLPCWNGVHPLWLLGYRAVVFLPMLTVLLLLLFGRGVVELYFYTQWTFALVTLYFAIGTFISANGCWRYSIKPPCVPEESDRFLGGDLIDGQTVDNSTDTLVTINPNEPMEPPGHLELDDGQKAGFLGYMMEITYQISAGASILTDIVFWVIIAPSDSHGLYNITLLEWCLHSVNIIFLLLDASINRLPFPFFRMAYLLIWTCAYGLFQWILHACCVSWWPYGFMELASPWAPLWYVALVLVHLPCYGLYFLIVKAKNSWFPKYFPNAFMKPKYFWKP